MSTQFVSEIILIEPFAIKSLLEFSLSHTVNDHAYLKCKGIISEENNLIYVNQTNATTQVIVKSPTENGSMTTLFSGYLQDIQITNQKDVYYLEITAVSSTLLLDIEKRNRSFQNTKASYEQLLYEVTQLNPQALFNNVIGSGKLQDQLIVQYEETDWQFMKRLVAILGGGLVGLAQHIKPRVYFGLPDPTISGEIISHNYQFKQDFQHYRQLTQNTSHDLIEKECSYYSVQTRQLFSLGDAVMYQGRRYQIIQVTRTYEKGMLIHDYVLTTTKAVTTEPIQNDQIKGVSLVGTVQKVQGDQLLIALDIDQPYGSQASFWFTYSTSYTSDNQIGWYMMPEVKDRVRVYFPTANEANAYAMGSIREGGDQLVPHIKTLKNKFGKTITLEPDQITIVGNGVEIILNDASGVTLKSNSQVAISGKQSVNIHGSQVLMDAGERIKLSVKHNSVTIDDRIVLNGTDVKMN